jgi:hypothetical protein
MEDSEKLSYIMLALLRLDISLNKALQFMADHNYKEGSEMHSYLAEKTSESISLYKLTVDQVFKDD